MHAHLVYAYLIQISRSSKETVRSVAHSLIFITSRQNHTLSYRYTDAAFHITRLNFSQLFIRALHYRIVQLQQSSITRLSDSIQSPQAGSASTPSALYGRLIHSFSRALLTGTLYPSKSLQSLSSNFITQFFPQTTNLRLIPYFITRLNLITLHILLWNLSFASSSLCPSYCFMPRVSAPTILVGTTTLSCNFLFAPRLTLVTL